jgi:hypothetical protein
MTTTSPSLHRVLVFIGERLVKATREAQMRPTKNTARRLRSLEMLAAACVADAARALRSSSAARVEAAPPAPAQPPPHALASPLGRSLREDSPPTEDLGPLLPQETPTESEADVRGVWTVPPG